MDDQSVFRAIGRRIVELRHERGVTQETLAARIGLDARDLRRLEAGSNATVRTLNAIARALDAPLAAIFVAPTGEELRRPGRPRVERAAAEQAAPAPYSPHLVRAHAVSERKEPAPPRRRPR